MCRLSNTSRSRTLFNDEAVAECGSEFALTFCRLPENYRSDLVSIRNDKRPSRTPSGLMLRSFPELMLSFSSDSCGQ